MYIARLTVISKSCVVSLETAGNVMELYADVVIIDNHTLLLSFAFLLHCAAEHFKENVVGDGFACAVLGF